MKTVFSVSDYITNPGDQTDAFCRCFSDAARAGGSILIPPGEYLLEGTVPLFSHLEIEAQGAKFFFPRTLPRLHTTMFAGENIRELSWHGGTFVGYVYDPAREENFWEPNAESVAIRINGGSAIRLSEVNGENLAGSVFFACGTEEAPMEHIDLSDMSMRNCGRFMWDYGYLWQRITFPENHTPCEVKNAYRYMPEEYYSEVLRVENGCLCSSRMPTPAKEDDTVSFFGEELPPILKKGKYYYAEETENGLQIREYLDGEPLHIPAGNYRFRLFRGLYRSFHMMYAPAGGGISKGGADVRFAKFVSMRRCALSASGDAMHFHHCKTGDISACRIEGARMGAMFLSAGCADFTLRDNIVDGGNCSRVLTVESGGRNILIENNIFTGGGRGTWIDTPHGIILRRNIFRNNTKKCTPDPSIGRLSPTEGNYERYAEIYFTTRQPGAVYDGIRMEENIVISEKGSTAAVVFLAHGKDIALKDNLFLGESHGIYVSPRCEGAEIAKGQDVFLLSHMESESFDIPGTVYLPEGKRKLPHSAP